MDIFIRRIKELSFKYLIFAIIAVLISCSNLIAQQSDSVMTRNKKISFFELSFGMGFSGDSYRMQGDVGSFNRVKKIPFGWGYRIDMWGEFYDDDIETNIIEHEFQLRLPLIFLGNQSEITFGKFVYSAGNVNYHLPKETNSNILYGYLFSSFIMERYSTYISGDRENTNKTETSGKFRIGGKLYAQSEHHLHAWILPFMDFNNPESEFGYEIGAGLNFGKGRYSIVYWSNYKKPENLTVSFTFFF